MDRAVFAITGPEAAPFLQNLLTHDLDRLAGQPAIYAGLLTPQGKIAFDFLLWRTEGGVLVDVHAGATEALRKRLTLFKLRAKVEIGAIQPVGVFHAGSAHAGFVADPRNIALGYRLIAPAETPAPIAEPEAYKALRIAVGVPDPVYDAPNEEAFALEALFEELDGVDFKKGCFVGQENVSRMKRRATTRKKFCPVTFEGDAPPFGAIVRAGAAELGSIRSAMPDRALAFLRLDRAREALAKGETIEAEGRPLRLDPPAWLIQPAGE
ncbi:MAG: folate-binding protein YgfZ [Hyphomonadaceae bacterium]